MRARTERRAGDADRAMVGALAAIVASFIVAQAVSAQARVASGVHPLSLEDALRMAESASEQVTMARAGVTRSQGELRRARSEYFPQIFAAASYTRTLDSEFSVFSSSEPDTADAEPCGTFMPDPALQLSERVDSLEAAVRCQSQSNPFADLGDLPFGRENQWRLDLSLSQTVFSGGRVQAQARMADAGRRVAQMDLTSARAQVILQVAEAYYAAALADRLYTISLSTLEQAETTLSQVTLARQVGSQPEFELLRAQVTRDTQRPVVIQRRADRDLAMLRLKQTLNLPADATVELTTELDSAQESSVVRLAVDLAGVEPDSSAAARMAVRQAMEAVVVQEAQRTIARAQRLPTLSLAMQYGRVGYPERVRPFDVPFHTNWTVGASVQVPIFTGGRLSGEAMIARANVEEAQARLELTEELAALDTRSAYERLAAAEATWAASTGTVTQATRAYTIAEVRYTEGISTQLELNDSRLLLQQAQANRAQAARDLQIARLRVALLPYLPLGANGDTPTTVQLPATTVQPQRETPPASAGVQQTSATQAGNGSSMRN